MKKILILSDTHGYLDDDILRHAKEHDEVWHAGDWGDPTNLEPLEKSGLVRGVYGNIDGQSIRSTYPEELDFTIEGVRVYMKHIAGYPGRYKTEVVEKIKQLHPQLVICGHSHILKVVYDQKFKHLHINSGAIGISGFHKVRTMISLEIDNGDMRNLRVIEFTKYKSTT